MKKQFIHTFVLLFLACVQTSGQQQVEYTHWSLAHILFDYEGSPVYDSFITGGPVVERMDSLGGNLLFYLTPQSNYDCRQAFRVGWNFDRPINDLEEGTNVNVEVFSYPVADTVRTMLDCFQTSKEAASHDEGVRIRLIGGDTLGLVSQNELAFYWEQSSPDLFKMDRPVEASSGSVPANASGSFVVQDLDKNPGNASIPFGVLALEISTADVFDFRVLYLYDGRESEISAAGAHRLLLDKLVVEHSITGNSAAPVMNFSLVGMLEEAVGHEVQIVIRFLDSYRRPLPGIQGDAAYCDSTGFAVAFSPVQRVPGRQYYLNELTIPMPYYALNLPTSQSGHTLYIYAEIFLDHKSIGLSRLTQTTFFW